MCPLALPGYDHGDTVEPMKVAVSIPDPVFKAADELAHDLKKSRSQLYAEALTEFLGTRGADAIRERLDAVYATESSKLDPALEQVQFEILEDETW